MNAAKVLAVTVLAGSVSIGLALLGERWLDPDEQPTERRRHGASHGLLDSLPRFRLPDLEGREISSDQWADRVVVLNFWATWCPPCVREMPLLDEWQRRHGQQGLQMVGIAIDRADEVAAFLDEHPVGYPILLGGMDSVALARGLGNRTGGLPFTVVFDRFGHRVFSYLGELDETLLMSEIGPLLPDAGQE